MNRFASLALTALLTGAPACAAELAPSIDPSEPAGRAAISPVETDINPIAGIAAGIAPPVVVLAAGAATEGPVWESLEQVLCITLPSEPGGLYRMDASGSAYVGRDANPASVQIGNTLDPAGLLLTFEAKHISRTIVGDVGMASVTASGWGPFVGVEPEAYAPFDSLEDGVFRANGMYVTDPGFYASPNGIALSPDQKTLYVGFTHPTNEPPFVSSYLVNFAGNLGASTKVVMLSADFRARRDRSRPCRLPLRRDRIGRSSVRPGWSADQSDRSFARHRDGVRGTEPAGLCSLQRTARRPAVSM